MSPADHRTEAPAVVQGDGVVLCRDMIEDDGFGKSHGFECFKVAYKVTDEMVNRQEKLSLGIWWAKIKDFWGNKMGEE